MSRQTGRLHDALTFLTYLRNPSLHSADREYWLTALQEEMRIKKIHLDELGISSFEWYRLNPTTDAGGDQRHTGRHTSNGRHDRQPTDRFLNASYTLHSGSMPRELPTREFSSALYILSPDGIPLVRDPNPANGMAPRWKLPGGRGEDGELPQETAIRETDEETGVQVSVSQMKGKYVKQDRTTHDFYIFAAELDELPRLKDMGDEGEEVRAFMPHQIPDLEMLPFHKQIILKEFTIP